jgi:NTE family protein
MIRHGRIGLALGGGAARGLAHIGVLEVLEEQGVPIDVIAGTSMGAIIGAMYALQPSAAELKRRFHAYLQSDAFHDARFGLLAERDKQDAGVIERLLQIAWKGLFYTLVMTRRSYYGEETSNQNFASMIDDVDIEQTRIPFCTVALDLISGREVVFSSGSLRQAVAASCALPGLLPPVEQDGRLLVDGGWIDAVPVEPARQLGADLVVAVDVANDLDPCGRMDSALDIAGRADSITRWVLGSERTRDADLVLRPDREGIHWADFSHFEEAIACGRREAEQRLREIHRLVRRRRWPRLLRGGALRTRRH